MPKLPRSDTWIRRICVAPAATAAHAPMPSRTRRLPLESAVVRESKLARAAQFGARVIESHSKSFHVGFGTHEIGARLLDLCLKQRGIQARQHLTFPHERIEIGVELEDGS